MFPSVKSWGFFIYLCSSYWLATPLVLLGWRFFIPYRLEIREFKTTHSYIGYKYAILPFILIICRSSHL